MSVVLDASAAYEMLAGDDWDASIREVYEFLAPDLIIAELLNARWKIARSGNVAPGIDPTLDFLARLRIMPSLPYAAVATRLAERLDHPVYDCFYVAVAQQENAQLLTADTRLMRKLRTHKLGALLA